MFSLEYVGFLQEFWFPVEILISCPGCMPCLHPMSIGDRHLQHHWVDFYILPKELCVLKQLSTSVYSLCYKVWPESAVQWWLVYLTHCRQSQKLLYVCLHLFPTLPYFNKYELTWIPCGGLLICTCCKWATANPCGITGYKVGKMSEKKVHPQSDCSFVLLACCSLCVIWTIWNNSEVKNKVNHHMFKPRDTISSHKNNTFFSTKIRNRVRKYWWSQTETLKMSLRGFT